jgi:hypothetical protein
MFVQILKFLLWFFFVIILSGWLHIRNKKNFLIKAFIFSLLKILPFSRGAKMQIEWRHPYLVFRVLDIVSSLLVLPWTTALSWLIAVYLRQNIQQFYRFRIPEILARIRILGSVPKNYVSGYGSGSGSRLTLIRKVIIKNCFNIILYRTNF